MSQFREVREELFTRLLELQRTEYTGTLETFEVHANRLKAQWHSTYDKYIQCLQHGYEVIIEGIESQIQKNHNHIDGGIK